LSGNIWLSDPLDSVDMFNLMKHAKKILSGSGAIQKEAYVMGVTYIRMRENTGWPETLIGDGASVSVQTRERSLLWYWRMSGRI
jgi:UDP-N-acetylglucosamine 2-epimerase (non-hydrolysing)